MQPTYSICVPNLNMEKTIGEALRSVLSQIDHNYEMVVVDDGSKDNSINILEELKIEFTNLRTIYLPRDKRRNLAETRNLSVENAKGDYCILHIDCDDIWEPYIQDFVKVFHALESIHVKPFLLSGQQINMGKRQFLLENGPYKNGHMLEDRDMWSRFFNLDAWISLDHVVFRTRLPLTLKQSLKKKFLLPIRQMKDNIDKGQNWSFYCKNLWKKYTSQNLKYRAFLMLMYPIAKIQKLFGKQKIEIFEPSVHDMEKLDRTGKTVSEIFNSVGREFDFSQLSQTAQLVFKFGSKERNFRDLT